MRIGIFNLKGGVGKTTFAFSIAKDLGFFLLSNDSSCIEIIYPQKSKIISKFQLIDDCVYDFGGFLSDDIYRILKECDYILMPIEPNLNSILKTIEAFNQIVTFNKNILLLINNFENEKEKEFCDNMLKDKIDKQFLRFYFKKSKIMNNCINRGKSITELWNETPLSKRSYDTFFKAYKILLDFILKTES